MPKISKLIFSKLCIERAVRESAHNSLSNSDEESKQEMTKQNRDDFNTNIYDTEIPDLIITQNNVFVEAEVIVEMSLLTESISAPNIIKIIEDLFDHILVKNINSRKVLTKILVKHNRMNIIAHLINKYKGLTIYDVKREIRQMEANGEVAPDLEEFASGKRKFIQDFFVQAINSDNIVILDNLMDPEILQYISSESSIVINALVKSFEYQYNSNIPINDSTRKLEILTIFCSYNNYEVTQILKLLDLLDKMLYQPSDLNIFSRSSNPLRLYVKMMYMIDTLRETSRSIKAEYEALEDKLDSLIYKILDEKESADILRTWFLEPYEDTNMLVIDHFNQFKRYNLLSHPKI
jgi:hypothetical protein